MCRSSHIIVPRATDAQLISFLLAFPSEDPQSQHRQFPERCLIIIIKNMLGKSHGESNIISIFGQYTFFLGDG
jgi:hypothetical protein